MPALCGGLNTGPLGDRTTLDHSNTRLIITVLDIQLNTKKVVLPMLRFAIRSQALSASFSLKQYFVPEGPWVPPTQKTTPSRLQTPATKSKQKKLLVIRSTTNLRNSLS